jgi:hypothetical protein
VTRYPATMPKDVLFGSCAVIEQWCRDNQKELPTLLDLGLARKARKRAK